MILNAKNGCLALGDTKMDYVHFGQGREVLVLIPGLSDGIRTVRGMAVALAMMYRKFARHYRVYVFSRKQVIPAGYSIEAMADDLKSALDQLDIKAAHVLGISQGGMIAQWLAIKYPDLVSKIILTVTIARPNDTVKQVVNNWISLAKNDDFKGIIVDTAERSYSPERLKRYRRLYPIVTKIGKPQDFTRFLIQAEACLAHDAYERLREIKCPTLVIGGGQDAIVGKDSAQEIADRIDGSRILIYERFSHAANEEAKDFQTRVINFLKK
jgi:pimeloyl-ACP methyl ester carboxylesterase